ncbi:hypothetical protein BCY91_05930 [Pelobium manganitolerans]|uniref:mannan endo-1,4-beta-mannosidase n=1 Tax=Pelobium manganitolerans TaxID=1842495 RepID=A0A419S4N1_9SPHI|nr:cellulase family glycosylhydrolase [Pelobium manganitolerans]RKD15066.1 hypothetical protein BCY91_05930 [Pelobium manganitolerans]
MLNKISGFFIAIFLFLTACANAQEKVFVNEQGKIKWTNSKKDAYFFGVNYSAPFVFGYRHIKASGISVEEAIKQDVYHLARLGINAYRIHVFDTEITDSVGNILDNEHLRLFDFLINELEKRDIKILLTPIAYWGNGYPEKDVPTGSFSFKYGKKDALVNPEAWKAQQNYLQQFFQRKNRYTGKTYQDDDAIIATEINNEPHHSGPKALTTEYINTMVKTIRNTGWTKPIFYNISESPKYADAVVKADVQGHSFQWYPSGLVANRTQQGNFLPHVSTYNIPFDTIPGFNKRAKIVYEFDGADIPASYHYPAMAKSFRNAGFQWATMFAYEPLTIAGVNTEYQTHYLNLAYTPSKAISFMIANQVFQHNLPANVSYAQNNSELVKDTLFYYANSSQSIVKTQKLKHIAGTGSSKIIEYSGNGAYFLDKITDGVWRLEVLPDVISLADPFAKTSPNRKVRAISWNNNTFKIKLPDLGETFTIKGANQNNSFVGKATKQAFAAVPGTYILSKKPASAFKPKQKVANLFLSEFVAPADNNNELRVYHNPPRNLSETSDILLQASIGGADSTAKVSVVFNMGQRRGQQIEMQKKGSVYEAKIPQSSISAGLLQYFITVATPESTTAFPENIKGSPYDWDFNAQPYEVFVNRANSSLTLFNALRDKNQLNYYNPDWENYGLAYTATTNANELAVTSIMKKTDRTNFMGWQTYIGDLVQNRKADLQNFVQLNIKASSSFKNATAKVALITKDGNAYAGNFTVTDSVTTAQIPLSNLKPEAMLLLPRPYPGFQPLFYQTNMPKTFSLADVERLEITYGYQMPETVIGKETSLSVINIDLK